VAAYDGELGLIRRHRDVTDHKAGQQKLDADRKSRERGAEQAPGRNSRRTVLGARNHLHSVEARKLELRETTP
jgi:hypothetical protein